MEPLAQTISVLTIITTAVMAASAAIQGVRHGLDLFGTSVIAVSTAVGGGTVRDLLLGRTPVFWIEDLTFILTAVPASFLMYWVARRLPSGNGRRERILMQLDAIGLALFTLIGVEVALDYDVDPIIAVIIGCVTGTVGGMIRDVLCNVTPSVLKEDLYATISLVGGAAYVFALPAFGDVVTTGICFVGMLFARLLVIARWKRAGV